MLSQYGVLYQFTETRRRYSEERVQQVPLEESPSTQLENSQKGEVFFCDSARFQDQVLWEQEGFSFKILYSGNPVVEGHYVIASARHCPNSNALTVEPFAKLTIRRFLEDF